MNILYRPADGMAGDFIPFCRHGEYHLFYLKDERREDNSDQGMPWHHVVTRDFVRFDDWGEALASGAPDEQDLCVFTGSVLEADGRFHIFYTGSNQRFAESGRPCQVLMHATSDDLRHWTKDPDWRLLAPVGRGYEADDWRDPFVFFNESAGEYWMLITARLRKGPSRHRGVIALAVSRDLRDWRQCDPFWAPGLYSAHEVPDLFRIGDWWYLVYSTFSERYVTHYRMSRALDGSWLAPANDSFDGHAYYAAKTAGDSEHRFAFGWLPTREGQTDQGQWQWGGHLVVHEVQQKPDGTLSVRLPQTVQDAFSTPVTVRPQPVLGQWRIEGGQILADSAGQFSALTLGELPKCGLVEAELTYEAGTASVGLLLRAQSDLEGYYQLRLEPANSRLVFDAWPRPGRQSFIVERPLTSTANQPVRLKVIVDDTCVVAYADDTVALSCRMYDRTTGQVGLFVAEGAAAFQNVAIRARSST